MNLSQIKLMLRIKNREIPTDEEVKELDEKLMPTCNYPIGALPHFMFDDYLETYHEKTVEENYIYCKELAHKVLNKYYTSDELEICSVYLLQLIYRYMFIPPSELFDIINPFLFVHSEKADIEYCLNQMRYRKLKFLLYDKNSNSEEITQLIDILAPAEEAYNKMVLESQKDH